MDGTKMYYHLIYWGISRVNVLSRRTISLGVCAYCFFMSLNILLLAADENEARLVETKLKAAFLVKLPQFIEWPQTAFKSKSETFRLGLVPNDAFTDFIMNDIEKQTCGGRGFQIVKTTKIEELQECHIVFVSKNAENLIPQILKSINDRPILTVGDGENFAHKGLIINFKKTSESKLRFEYNLQAARSANLKISAKFLQVSSPASTNNPGNK